MKLQTRTLFAGLGLAALLSAPLAIAAVQERPHPPEGKPEHAQEEHEDGGVEGAMQALNGCMKRMGKAFDSKNLAAVAQVAVEMQRAVNSGKTETPSKVNDISDAKAKAEFMLGFRKQLIALEKSLLDLELAALDGKADSAKKIFDDVVKPMKDTGHAKYKD